MQKVCYSKISKERKTEFQIITNIIKKDDGLCVRKMAASNASNEFVEKLYDNYLKICTEYKHPNIEINKCRVIEKGIVEFDYIDSKLLEQEIEECIDDFEKTFVLINKYYEALSMVNNIDKFEVCKEFTDVFGEGEYTDLLGLPSSSISNIDMLFDNVFVKSEKYIITDYEWVFDFKVPFKFILFRTLFLSNAFSKNTVNFKEKIYDKFEITKNEIELFINMEINFQNFVSGRNLINEYKKKKNNKCLLLDDNILSKSIIVYKLVGIKEDLSETILSSKQINATNVNINETINDSELFTDYRIEICTNCVLKIKSIKMDDKYNIIGEINTNASLIQSIYDYYFTGETAKINIKNNKYSHIFFEAQLYYFETSLINNYVELYISARNSSKELCEQVENLRTQNSGLENDKAFLKEEVEQLLEKNKVSEERIAYMENTLVWRVRSKFARIKHTILKKR